MFYKAVAPGNIGHGVKFLDAAELVARHGYEGFFFDADKDLSGSVSQTKELLAQYKLKPAGFGLPVEYRKGEKEYEEGMAKLPAYAKFAQEIGIKGCVTWIFPFHDRLTYSENFELHRRRLAPAAQLLKDHGINFGMEFLGPKKLRRNVKFEFVHDLDGMLELCDALGTGNCGILMDAWHWHMAGQTFEDFDKLAQPGKIVCVHVMDAPPNIPDEEQEDLVRRLPGATGVINIAEFFAGLRKANYDGPVMVEPFERFLSQVPFEESLKIVMKALNKVWPD